jgi:cell division transport system permease protein
MGRWRTLPIFVISWISLVLIRGVKGWVRNLATAAPALGSMTALLFLCGLIAVAAVAVLAAVAQQTSEAYVLRVYLSDSAQPADVDSLQSQLASDPRVLGVDYIDRDQALQRAERRPGIAGLIADGGGNPFPASLEVHLAPGTGIAAVAREVASSPAVDPDYPTSYDPDAYARLQQIARIAGAVAAAFLSLIALTSITVTANGVRAVILNRRDEIRVMRLVGAPWWAVRLPFVVEGAMTGAVAGILGGVAVAACAGVAFRASQHTFIEFLPGVSLATIVAVGLGVCTVGMLLGSGAGLLALRRLPR